MDWFWIVIIVFLAIIFWSPWTLEELVCGIGEIVSKLRKKKLNDRMKKIEQENAKLLDSIQLLQDRMREWHLWALSVDARYKMDEPKHFLEPWREELESDDQMEPEMWDQDPTRKKKTYRKKQGKSW